MKKNIFHSKSSMALTSFLLSLVLSLCFFSTLATFQRFQHPVNSDGILNFLVVGDWGRRGTYNQSEVAQQMGRVGEELDINFVVSVGDNFYDDGLKSVNDSAFQDSFTNIYTAHGLQKQWYSILGNHDYRGDVEAQLDPILRKKDRRWLCVRSFVVNTKIADFFFVDTTPFVNHYFTDPEDHTYDWRGVVPRKNYINNLLKEVDSALKDSKSQWKIVVGHHGIRSVGHHGDTQELVDRLLPILLVNNVDLYINGHDHCLQRISCSKSSLQFLTSGGGSKAWNGDVKDENNGTVEFFYDGQGFMSVQLSQIHAQIAFYDVYGRVLHTYNASSSSNPLYSTV